jgi:hypothetical protein
MFIILDMDRPYECLSDGRDDCEPPAKHITYARPIVQMPFRPALFDAVACQPLRDVGLDRLRRRHVGISGWAVALLQLRQAAAVE